MTALDAPNLTLLLLATIVGLAMAFVWMFWVAEHRDGHSALARVLARLGYGDNRADHRDHRD